MLVKLRLLHVVDFSIAGYVFPCCPCVSHQTYGPGSRFRLHNSYIDISKAYKHTPFLSVLINITARYTLQKGEKGNKRIKKKKETLKEEGKYI